MKDPDSTLFDDSHIDDIYDPFEDDEDIDGAEENLEVAPMTFTEAMLEHKPEAPSKKKDERTPLEKLNDLLASVNDQRPTFLGILAFCSEAKPVYEVNEAIDELRKKNRSIYSAANFCSLLERAGGLVRVTKDGAPYDEAEKGEGTVVIIDGVEYYEPGEAPQVYWQTTDEGNQVVAADNPYQRLLDHIEGESHLSELYMRVLLMSARNQGATARDLTSVVDMDPLAKDPVVLTAPHFSIPLKRCGALEFTDAWHITDLGLKALEEIFGISQDSLASEIADVEEHAVPVPEMPDDEDFYIGD